MKAIKNDSMPNTVDREGARSGGVEIGDHDRVYVREGDVVAGKYRVERLLGAGGVGFVVAAKHVDLGGYFALKFLRKRFLLDKSIVERFTREAKAACRIKSEYVARVYDVGLNDGAPFLVMEHLVGRDLASVLTERGRLGIEEAVDYVMQACAALAVVHAHGVVHRDIKPENLFLVDHDGVGTIKLLDFGISKIAPASERPVGEWAPEGEALTGTLMFGSPFYMSPEHVRSSATVDARSDVWSLGVVLYELIAGATPFQGESVPDVCAAILEQDLRSVREASPEVPVELSDVVGRCLQKDPANRFGSVAELAVALLPFGSPRALAVAEGSAWIRRAAISAIGGWGEGSAGPVRPSLPGSIGPLSNSLVPSDRGRIRSEDLQPLQGTPVSFEGTTPRKRGLLLVALGAAALASLLSVAYFVFAGGRGHPSRATAALPAATVQLEPAPAPKDQHASSPPLSPSPAPSASPAPNRVSQPGRQESPIAPTRPPAAPYSARPQTAAPTRAPAAARVSASSSAQSPATSVSTPLFLTPPQAPGRPDLGY
jgi:eukaryotic-like serine/threonine-protein kinase